jgi:hypothetical protein
MWEPRRLTTPKAFTACYRGSFYCNSCCDFMMWNEMSQEAVVKYFRGRSDTLGVWFQFPEHISKYVIHIFTCKKLRNNHEILHPLLPLQWTGFEPCKFQNTKMEVMVERYSPQSYISYPDRRFLDTFQIVSKSVHRKHTDAIPTDWKTRWKDSYCIAIPDASVLSYTWTYIQTSVLS